MALVSFSTWLLETIGAFFVIYVVSRLISLFLRIYTPSSYPWRKLREVNGDDAWAVVTGATDGIGKEFAFQLAKKGFNIVLVARNDEKLARVSQEIARKYSGIKTKQYVFDFGRYDTKDLVDHFYDFVASLNVAILVNNVGMSHEHPKYFLEENREQIDQIINVNVVNTVRMTQKIVPKLVARRAGLVLNVGSMSGEAPTPLLQVYAGTKAFLKNWSMALATELAKDRVHVELLNTYFVMSAMSRQKRPTWSCPTPADYVAAALRQCGKATFSTPYPAHAILYALLSMLPTWMVVKMTFAQMSAARAKALAKIKAK